MELSLQNSDALNELFDKFDDPERIGFEELETLDLEKILTEVLLKEENHFIISDDDDEGQTELALKACGQLLGMISKMKDWDSIFHVYLSFGGDAYQESHLLIAGFEKDILQRLDHLKTWTPS
jgi:hypothetical protein